MIGLVGGVTDAIARTGTARGHEDVALENLADAGALLSLDPSDVTLHEKCTQAVSTSTTKQTPRRDQHDQYHQEGPRALLGRR